MEANEKKAFVFDTNFIIQTKDLEEVIKNLSDRFSVFVTQVSVEERIAQECREIDARYHEISKLSEKYSDIAEITIIKPCEREQEFYRVGMQRKYEVTFGDRLIPFVKDGDMLSKVLNRAYRKKPPFLADDKASDKGFKDALIWESLLAFFKDTGENEVLLITDDGGFTKNSSLLCAEFFEVTGKKLYIHPNSYYRELLKPELVEEPKQPPQILNLGELREKIYSVVSDICHVIIEDYWGNEESRDTFSLNKPVDLYYVGSFFENLKVKRLEHLFDISIHASDILELDDRVTDTEYMIPMAAIDNAVTLYDEILDRYPEHMEQFLLAAAKVLNSNYHEPKVVNSCVELADDDDELPF